IQNFIKTISLKAQYVNILVKWTAPASLSAEAGGSLVLSCSITTAAGDTVRQVRWHNKHNKILLAYEQSAPIRFSHRNPKVQLTASHNALMTGGCYRCVFDVYPTGLQEGKTCVSVIDDRSVIILGDSGFCYLKEQRVLQVLWRKTAEQGDTITVAAYAKGGHQTITDQFMGRVSLSRSLGDTQLTIQQARTEDEACYTCEFHTYPDALKAAPPASQCTVSTDRNVKCLCVCVCVCVPDSAQERETLCINKPQAALR
uniref:Ig-like domain-containing protein n=1 Tax=Sparus aurata TaxID=8175 RepID=A0A671XCP2_SPAAU